MELLSSEKVRRWYNEQVKKIPVVLAVQAEELARQAYELRNKAIKEAREMMQDKRAAMTLDRENPIISFEMLISKKMEKKKISRELACWDTIQSAIRTNEKVNTTFGLNADGSLRGV